MKIKKILSLVVATAMAVTTLSAFSTTATAVETVLASGTHTVTQESWGLQNTFYNLSTRGLADTDIIKITDIFTNSNSIWL